MDCFATLAMTGRDRPSTRSSSPRRRGSSTPRLFGSITSSSGILDHPPSRVMTTKYALHSRDADRPRFASSFALFETRGRREDRVLAAPAVPRAICANKTAHEHTGQREHSGLPCAMALRLTSCSSRRTALLPPSPALLIASLTPAPRRPNHTTSPYASGAYVSRASRVHRISPHVRDDRERPSVAVRQAELCR
jgi:hypothetical protein